MDRELPGEADPTGQLDAVVDGVDGTALDVGVGGEGQALGAWFAQGQRTGCAEDEGLAGALEEGEIDESVLDDLKAGDGHAERFSLHEVVGDDLHSPPNRPHRVGAEKHGGQQLERRNRLAVDGVDLAPCRG